MKHVLMQNISRYYSSIYKVHTIIGKTFHLGVFYSINIYMENPTQSHPQGDT